MSSRRLRLLPVALAVALLGLWLTRPVAFLGWAAWKDARLERVVPAGFADDASALERTRVLETWAVPAEREAALEGLRALLARAEELDLPVSIGGARHTMGGHTIAADGVVIDMTGFRSMELDAERDVLRVDCGARWSEVLRTLDAHGRSVAVMQSNDSFTVGGSLSVDCHGWQHGSPPIASSVLAFRILLADGQLLECSREENAELFSLALGGYGLFGVIVDADLRVVPNELYHGESVVVATADLGARFLAAAADPEVGMAIGRVSIRRDALFEEAILKTFRRVEPAGALPPITPSDARGLRRVVFRASVGSDYGKALRWTLETRLGNLAAGGDSTRNSLLAEPVDVYANADPEGTDVLHESFVPHARLAEFLERARPLLEASSCDLLNVTVRDVREDRDAFLRYADRDVFALVMLFHQRFGEEHERAMGALTRELIDLALALEGRYYLPYRLHATREQFLAAYPRSREFFEAKRRYDPAGRFTNRFYTTYGP